MNSAQLNALWIVLASADSVKDAPMRQFSVYVVRNHSCTHVFPAGYGLHNLNKRDT